MLRVVFALFLICTPALALASKVALVIGNSNYTSVAPLDNPQNDASAVTQKLQAQGFEVLARTNLTRSEMRNALREFREMADGADVALVYYAGHGIEVSGTNFLVPIDARLEDERDAGLEMVEIDLILRQISGARQLKMVVLDACRNNPFVAKMQSENSGRGVSSGLGRIEYAEADTLIAYAAAAGAITPDGQAGGNSPFTAAFLNAMDGPPTDVRRLLGRVRDEMRLSVPGAAPFVYTSLGGDEMVINPRSTAKPQVAAPTPEPEQPTTGGPTISQDFVTIDRDGTYQEWNDFLIRHEDQSDHPLYAFALEKREELKPAIVPRAGDSITENAAADAPSPFAEPLPGVSRDQVARQLQTVMRERGCYRGAIDGILGKGSARGLRQFGDQIGTTLSASQRSDVAELQTVIAKFEEHPATDCPVVKTVSRPAATAPAPKPKPAPAPSAAAAPAAPAAAPEPIIIKRTGPSPAPETPNSPYAREDSTKLPPWNPSDCIGARRKLHDCD